MNLKVNWPLFRPESRGAAIVFTAGLVLGSILAWCIVFTFNLEAFGRIRIVELIVGILVLAMNVYGILFRDYRGFIHNVTVSLSGYALLAVIGFILGRVSFWSVWNHSRMVMYFLQFILYIILAFFLAVLPVLVICFLMWLVLAIFGEDV